MASLRPICGGLVACVTAACTMPGAAIEPFLDDDKSDGAKRKLQPIERHKLRVDEPSDLVFANGRLYTVSDAHSKIYEISRDGDVEDVIDVQGSDLEAVAHDPDTDEFLIADETRAKIWRVDRDGARTAAIEVDDVVDGNSGIEGIAFGARGHLFVAKEKSPARIIELDRDGVELARTRVEFADDLSALAFNPDDRRLYALSDEEHALYRLDADLDAIAAWKLPVAHPEGLAFEDGLVYIASDSEERIYVFELE